MDVAPSRTKQVYLLFMAVCFALWLGLVYEPLYNAVVIWIGNDIYNHCLIVIPASLYLIWEKRKVLTSYRWQSSWLAAVALFLQLILYTLGTAADIQLFQHAALFAMLPTIFWLFAGDRIAWELKFPLAFMVFSIPVGEELIPFLQEITADMAVAMLQWTGVPLFRSGLFIEIPGGKFLVAEACSGVSFLIASIVLGNLYAYMNLKSWRYRLFFVVLSVIFPILANAIRVYGIIMIAHLTNMEHAVGADHLIYGWFFFAFVLVCLFLIGELIRKLEKSKLDPIRPQQKENTDIIGATVFDVGSSKASIIAAVLLCMTLVQDFRMQNSEVIMAKSDAFDFPFPKLKESQSSQGWTPLFVKYSESQKQIFEIDNVAVTTYFALYQSIEGEVVSSMNRIYQQEQWTLASAQTTNIGGIKVNKHYVASSVGTRRVVYFWYIINDQVATSRTDVKLQEALNRLRGVKNPATFVGISIEGENASQLQQYEIVVEAFIKTAIDQSLKSFEIQDE